VEPSKIVLVDLPRITREIIEQAVGAEPDMVIVDGLAGGASLPDAVQRREPDFVISGRDYEFAEVCAILDERPRLRVLAVLEDGREATLYELRPTRTPLGEVSPQTIVEAIRGTRRAMS
jgi:DNA-binding NarL/FixJ family response regulator